MALTKTPRLKKDCGTDKSSKECVIDGMRVEVSTDKATRVREGCTTNKGTSVRKVFRTDKSTRMKEECVAYKATME